MRLKQYNFINFLTLKLFNFVSMEDQLLEGLNYVLPALVTGAVAYYMFSGYIKHGNQEKKLEMLAQKKKESLPIKLQAYERMLLFIERINPNKLLVRIKPIGNSSQEYFQLLLKNIEQEYEHNMVQQLYISDESWKVIVATKTTIINQLKSVAETNDSAEKMREQALLVYTQKESPSDTAIAFLKNDVKRML